MALCIFVHPPSHENGTFVNSAQHNSTTRSQWRKRWKTFRRLNFFSSSRSEAITAAPPSSFRFQPHVSQWNENQTNNDPSPESVRQSPMHPQQLTPSGPCSSSSERQMNRDRELPPVPITATQEEVEDEEDQTTEHEPLFIHNSCRFTPAQATHCEHDYENLRQTPCHHQHCPFHPCHPADPPIQDNQRPSRRQRMKASFQRLLFPPRLSTICCGLHAMQGGGDNVDGGSPPVASIAALVAASPKSSTSQYRDVNPETCDANQPGRWRRGEEHSQEDAEFILEEDGEEGDPIYSVVKPPGRSGGHSHNPPPEGPEEQHSGGSYSYVGPSGPPFDESSGRAPHPGTRVTVGMTPIYASVVRRGTPRSHINAPSSSSAISSEFPGPSRANVRARWISGGSETRHHRPRAIHMTEEEFRRLNILPNAGREDGEYSTTGRDVPPHRILQPVVATVGRGPATYGMGGSDEDGGNGSSNSATETYRRVTVRESLASLRARNALPTLVIRPRSIHSETGEPATLGGAGSSLYDALYSTLEEPGRAGGRVGSRPGGAGGDYYHLSGGGESGGEAAYAEIAEPAVAPHPQFGRHPVAVSSTVTQLQDVAPPLHTEHPPTVSRILNEMMTFRHMDSEGDLSQVGTDSPQVLNRELAPLTVQTSSSPALPHGEPLRPPRRYPLMSPLMERSAEGSAVVFGMSVRREDSSSLMYEALPDALPNGGMML